MIKISIDSSAIKAKLEKIKNIDTKPLMQQIATDMKNQVDIRFRKCEGPDGTKWAELSPATIAQRRKNSTKPLNDTGDTRNTIVSYSDEVTAIVGTNHKIDKAGRVSAAVHQYGAEIDKKERKGTMNWKVRKDGKMKLAKKSKANFETDVTIKAHTVRIPARPFLGFSRNQIIKYEKMGRKYFAEVLKK